MNCRPALALAVVALLLAAPLRAHDFWIEPSSFRPATGSMVAVRLLVGQKFRGDPVPRNPALIERFVLANEAGETPVPGRPSGEPAGFVRIDSAGMQVIGYRSRNSQVVLEAEKFEEYLREEGLEAIIASRARRGDSAKPARDAFSRCAKALLSSGGTSAGFDKALGFTLELIPDKNPYTLKGGGELPVRLLYDGKPLAGALLVALSSDDPDHTLSLRSDKNGRVHFRLPKGGIWLIKAVHIVPAAPGADADWESLWASLTFDVPVDK